MPVPPTATEWADALDPSDLTEFVMDLSPWLQSNESLESYELTLSPEAIDAGIYFATDPLRIHKLIDGNRRIRFWPVIDAPDRGAPAFDGGGTKYPLVAFFTTNSVPSRQFERTFLIRVAQQ